MAERQSLGIGLNRVGGNIKAALLDRQYAVDGKSRDWMEQQGTASRPWPDPIT